MDPESPLLQEAKEKANHPCVSVVLILGLILNNYMLVVGITRKDDCPVKKDIPIFLIVAGAVGVLSRLVPLVNRKLDWSLCHLIIALLVVFELIWLVVGSVWVYSIEVNYNEGPNYCNETVYRLSFWVLTFYWAFFGLCVIVGCFFCCCLINKSN